MVSRGGLQGPGWPTLPVWRLIAAGWLARATRPKAPQIRLRGALDDLLYRDQGMRLVGEYTLAIAFADGTWQSTDFRSP